MVHVQIRGGVADWYWTADPGVFEYPELMSIPHPSRTYFGLGLLSRAGLELGCVLLISPKSAVQYQSTGGCTWAFSGVIRLKSTQEVKSTWRYQLYTCYTPFRVVRELNRSILPYFWANYRALKQLVYVSFLGTHCGVIWKSIWTRDPRVFFKSSTLTSQSLAQSIEASDVACWLWGRKGQGDKNTADLWPSLPVTSVTTCR